HCDERGTREYNLGLGERRANATKQALVALGIAANRVNVISYGKERPAVLGHNEQAWAQNRRAVTVVNCPSRQAHRGAPAPPEPTRPGVGQAPFFCPNGGIPCPSGCGGRASAVTERRALPAR